MISINAAISGHATLGKNVSIGNFTTIEDDVFIGDHTVIGNNVSILKGSRIGSHCQIHSGAVLGGTPQDLKYRGEQTYLEIGDRNKIHECVTINKGTSSKGVTKIGSDNLIMAGVHIGHDGVIGNHCVIGFSAGIAGEVVIEDYVNISGLTGIHQFSTIGRHCMVSGLSRVVKDIPPYIIAARDPLSFAGVNVVGLTRSGFSQATLTEIKDIYNIIFRQNRNTSSALALVEEKFQPSIERNTIIDFIRRSSRGILNGRVFEPPYR